MNLFPREEDWKSVARNKLRQFEDELQNAFDTGMSNYSGQKAWSFVNSCIYCFSVISTIGKDWFINNDQDQDGEFIQLIYSFN